MVGFLIDIALFFGGGLVGRNRRERHLARKAADPARESARTFVTRVVMITGVVWLLGFHGLNTLELWAAAHI